jgi:fatty-acyl-CoA synthase
MVRQGYVAAFTVPDERLVIIAERAAGNGRADPAPAIEAVRAAVLLRHGLTVADARVVPAGTIPRTTSGKLARRASRAQYLDQGVH